PRITNVLSASKVAVGPIPRPIAGAHIMLWGNTEQQEMSMRAPVLAPVLLLSAAVITPVHAANWFSNPYLNVNRNIGSAPTPTPEQTRQNQLPVLVLERWLNQARVARQTTPQQYSLAVPQRNPPALAPAR